MRKKKENAIERADFFFPFKLMQPPRTIDTEKFAHVCVSGMK